MLQACWPRRVHVYKLASLLPVITRLDYTHLPSDRGFVLSGSSSRPTELDQRTFTAHLATAMKTKAQIGLRTHRKDSMGFVTCIGPLHRALSGSHSRHFRSRRNPPRTHQLRRNSTGRCSDRRTLGDLRRHAQQAIAYLWQSGHQAVTSSRPWTLMQMLWAHFASAEALHCRVSQGLTAEVCSRCDIQAADAGAALAVTKARAAHRTCSR